MQLQRQKAQLQREMDSKIQETKNNVCYKDLCYCLQKTLKCIVNRVIENPESRVIHEFRFPGLMKSHRI